MSPDETKHPVIWKKGEAFHWLEVHSEGIVEVIEAICESMRGESDEAINAAIQSYLGGLVSARNASLH
jgi:hypothetical protein